MRSVVCVLAAVMMAGCVTTREMARYGVGKGYARPYSVEDWHGEKVAVIYPDGDLELRADPELVIRILIHREVLGAKELATYREVMRRRKKEQEQHSKQILALQEKQRELTKENFRLGEELKARDAADEAWLTDAIRGDDAVEADD